MYIFVISYQKSSCNVDKAKENAHTHIKGRNVLKVNTLLKINQKKNCEKSVIR